MSGECGNCGEHTLECKCRSNMGWISVSERLPENISVLMSYNNLVMEGEFANGKFYHPTLCAHVPGYCQCREQEGITHWMPFPDPPKDD